MEVKQVGGNPYPAAPEPALQPSAVRDAVPAKVAEQPAPDVAKLETDRGETPKVAVPSEEERKATRDDVEKVLKKLNIVMNAMSIQAKFEVHQPTKEIMIRVVNVDSGQVIREIPPKKILDMVAKMQELVGLLLDERG